MTTEMIALISVIISGVSLLITVIFNIIVQFQSVKDREPQLSFSLKEYDLILYLLVENTGLTTAKDIRINILKIHNNGQSGLTEDYIFNIPFELAPKEKIQGMIAFSGQNISTHIFPFIDLEISYKKSHKKRNVKYNRQVFYMALTENRISVDTNIDINRIDKNIEQLHKSQLRIANYLDGCQIAPFDDLNIISSRNLQTDVYNAINGEIEEIKDRNKCIEDRLKDD
ncbi:MAG: hypothetical protein RSE41_05635 [Clostridia bacterium]